MDDNVRVIAQTALERSLNWLQKYRDEFSFRREADTSEQVLLLKPFAEYLLTLNILRSLGIRDQELIANLSWAWAETDQGTTLAHLLMARPDLVDLVSIVANFSQSGFHNERLDRWLVRLWALRSTHTNERPVWSHLALLFNYWRLGLADFPTDLLATSWLGHEPEPWTISDATAYAVTHEVFYITDFGQRRGEELTPSLKQYLQLWLPVWTECSLIEENWDLVGEWLMVAASLRSGSWSREHLLRLLSAQEEDDYYPAPRNAGYQFVRAHHSTVRTRFLRNYHTTLVGLLAVAMLLYLPSIKNDKEPYCSSWPFKFTSL